MVVPSLQKKRPSTPGILLPSSSDPLKSGKKKYMGEERRRGNRRKGQNRRADVRFDLTKTDRRQTEGRRETDATVKFW